MSPGQNPHNQTLNQIPHTHTHTHTSTDEHTHTHTHTHRHTHTFYPTFEKLGSTTMECYSAECANSFPRDLGEGSDIQASPRQESFHLRITFYSPKMSYGRYFLSQRWRAQSEQHSVVPAGCRPPHRLRQPDIYGIVKNPRYYEKNQL